MKLFGKTLGAVLAFGAAMTALVGKDAVSAEETTAANEELTASGITGAQLINQATFQQLEEKAGRVDAAEATAKGFTDALATAGATDVAALVAQRDGYKVKADLYDKQPGASHTNPALEAGKSDVEPTEPDAHQVAISNLAHNKALDGHPVFG